MENEEIKKPKYLLPRVHLSWSQMDLFHKNPERYKREYFENGKRLDTRYLDFGKGFANAIEELCHTEERLKSRELAVKEMAEKYAWGENEIEVFTNIETYDSPEHKLEVEVRGVPLLSFIDNYHTIYHKFLEYKTGKHPWTQALVQKHGQLLYYAVGIRAKTGLDPWGCKLIWIETQDVEVEKEDFWAKADKKLSLTGRVKEFEREFDKREIDNMEDLIEETARQIDEAYRKFISEI